jgi:hypothetical protein
VTQPITYSADFDNSEPFPIISLSDIIPTFPLSMALAQPLCTLALNAIKFCCVLVNSYRLVADVV